jgi:hypothetical protein
MINTPKSFLFETPFPAEVGYPKFVYPRLDKFREQLFEAPPTPTIPPLLYTESSPLDLTLYVKIALGGESPAQPMTGIFIPQNYRIPSQIDLILYLQGHHKGGNFPTTLSIDQYWGSPKKYPFWRLREGINGSGKNVILVAPTLGPGSETGWLTGVGGLDQYLNQVRAALIAYYDRFKQLSDPPYIGDIILACHSGGGRRMQQIVETPQTYTNNIRQCWGFDCLYGDTNLAAWIAWAKSRTVNLFIHYGNGGTDTNSETLRKMASNQKVLNISVEGSTTLDHNRVPITHWHNRLQSARFLLAK